ncbi:unnamed protein product [Adineta ricciae]|uniref:PKD/REJ-like domain-containing protein n=1 Tax=Adineta ricciae TaxID=249248 RepID=A0A816BWZ2_ADIRI|nr:unnamed protein product [Adineta ricciae]
MAANTSISIMSVSSSCSCLFIDASDALYCSLSNHNQVVKKWLGDSSTIATIVAGDVNGTSGSSSYRLCDPRGIFVNHQFDLYVADSVNDRVQLFRLGQSNAITIAGNTSINVTISLNKPTGVVLDIDNYLFIVDSNNNRIVRSQPNGFSCIMGCSVGGPSINQLLQPERMAFDSYGNMYVADTGNARILQFVLLNNSIDTTTLAIPMTTTQEEVTSKITSVMLQTSTGVLSTTLEIKSSSMQVSDISTTHNAEVASTALLTNSPPTLSTFTATTSLQQPTSNQSTFFLSCTDRVAAKYPIEVTTEIPTTTTTTTTTAQGQITSTIQSTTVSSTGMTRNTSLPMSILTATTSLQEPTSHQTGGCYPPNVTLTPSTARLQYRRSQDISVTSFIDVHCNRSFTLTTQWIINNYSVTSTIDTQSSELFIPAKTLPYGIYQMDLTVTILHLSTSTSSVVVEIISSNIISNLIQYGTSMITQGIHQDLCLDPGSYSVDPDQDTFNASEWTYKYYCRVFGVSEFPTLQGSLLTVDDMRNDSANLSCLSNRTGWRFDNAINSSFTILSGSLRSNQTYQFMVAMQNIPNPSKQVTGYLLVNVEDVDSPMIVIGCVISQMCISNVEYQLVNPTTAQLALFSMCVGNCSIVQSVQWKIYRGERNASSNVTQWSLFNQTDLYENIWFFGRNTRNLTIINKVFLSYSQYSYWRFQVDYEFESVRRSSSALNVVLNQPPVNGTCLIDPVNGTTSTLFDVNCMNWVDNDGIKDYLLYVSTSNQSQEVLVAYSLISTFAVRFTSGDEPTNELHVIIHIRDEFDCFTEFHLSSTIIVQADVTEMNTFMNEIQNSSSQLVNNPFVQLLRSENQNVVGQVLSLFSNELNKINEETIAKAVANGISSTDISVTSLQTASKSLNTSSLSWNEYEKQVNYYANVREYLIGFVANLAITTPNSIELQSSTLSQLTKSTNQLTRNTLRMAMDRCYELSESLCSMSTRISSEQTQTITSYLVQCATNLVTGVNGALQARMNVLDVDFTRATQFPVDYDTNMESEWSNLNLFANGNDFSWSTIEKNRDLYYQQQLANEIRMKTNAMMLMISSSLDVQLNVKQTFVVNTSEVFMSQEKTSLASLFHKEINQSENSHIRFPSILQTNLNENQTISLRTLIQPLASFDRSTESLTNLSRSVSLTIVDKNGEEVKTETDEDHLIEIIIPRDPQFVLPSMTLYNVTSSTTNSTQHHHQVFFYHYVNITSSLPISIHTEIHPLDVNISYLLIYKLDGIPQVNSSVKNIDGWALLCAGDCSMTNESVYGYFIDNEQTVGHASMVIGLREVEDDVYCSNASLRNELPITDDVYSFRSDYEMRVYSSGCYYMDEESGEWKGNGLKVGASTNHYETQCFSNHL